MASGDTDLKVCSDALLMLGAKSITSFNEGTDASNICDRIYPDLKKATLQAYPWSFTFKKVALAQTINTPVNQYRYEYQLPSDRLGTIRRAYNSTAVGARTFADWTIQGDKLLTNEETVVIDYQFLPTEAEMPSYFVQLLKYMMHGTWQTRSQTRLPRPSIGRAWPLVRRPRTTEVDSSAPPWSLMGRAM